MEAQEIKRVKQYIDNSIEDNIIPTTDGYFIYLIDEKDITPNKAMEVYKDKGVKGFIYAYARTEIVKRISQRGRNSQSYMRLLDALGANPNEAQASKEIVNFKVDWGDAPARLVETKEK